MRAAAAIAVGALVSAFAPSASAFEKQFHVGASFGYAALFGDAGAHGFGGGLHFAYGVNDYINLLAEVDATAHPASHLTLVTTGFGATYIIDVVRWVPWVGLEVGPAAAVSMASGCGTGMAAACTAFKVNGAIPFGIDYQISRSFAVGLEGRFQLLLLNGSPAETLGVFARAEYVWGY